jgi:glutathionylspermidine synthase
MWPFLLFDMKRVSSPAVKFNYEHLESEGFHFHSVAGEEYWSQKAFYSFTPEEIQKIRDVTNELHVMMLKVVEHVIVKNKFKALQIQKEFIPLIRESWENDYPSIYGRFDLWHGGEGFEPKLYEYNADTPTSLVEGGKVQAAWLKSLRTEDQFVHAQQFNEISWRLTNAWRDAGISSGVLHCAYVGDSLEDKENILFMAECARAAGIVVEVLPIECIVFDSESMVFRGQKGEVISHLFKLYPWEWLTQDDFGRYLTLNVVQCIEPAWKMILSNKAMLPIAWELFEGHKNLLPAFDTAEKFGTDPYVRKPIFSREGANILIKNGDSIFETPGTYGKEGYIYQSFCPLPSYAHMHPVIGSWVIGGEAAGVGIREDRSLVSGNKSEFVPHVIQKNDLRHQTPPPSYNGEKKAA